MRGHSIIVLSGYSEIDQNLRVAFREYDVVDVFDKGSFLEERSCFKQLIDKIIERLRSVQVSSSEQSSFRLENHGRKNGTDN